MSNFIRAVSLSASGFVVVFGGFLILASMKAKDAITESLPPPHGRWLCLVSPRIRRF